VIKGREERHAINMSLL